MDYSKMTNKEFIDILVEVINEQPASNLLSIDGIYEILSEEFNNEILDRWENQQRQLPHPAYARVGLAE